MKIICNSLIIQAEGEGKIARAVPCWVGCKFANGVECTEEIARKMVESIDLENFAPSLLIDHEWSAEKVVGRMIACSLVGERVICEFDIFDDDNFAKIKSKEWENISITFDDENYKVLECSIVVVPAIFGAKIWAKDNENENPEKMQEKEEEEPGNVVAPPRKEEGDKTEGEKAREEFMEARKADAPCPEEAEKTEENENICKKDVQNSKNSAVIVENARLKREIAELKAQILRNEREQKANALVNGWVQAGATLPSQAKSEISFVLNLLEKDNQLYDNYCALKNGQGNIGSAIIGRRRSVANATVDAGRSRFESLNEQIVAERIGRRSN